MCFWDSFVYSDSYLSRYGYVKAINSCDYLIKWVLTILMQNITGAVVLLHITIRRTNPSDENKASESHGTFLNSTQAKKLQCLKKENEWICNFNLTSQVVIIDNYICLKNLKYFNLDVINLQMSSKIVRKNKISFRTWVFQRDFFFFCLSRL